MSSDKSFKGKAKRSKPDFREQDLRSSERNDRDRNPSKNRREGWTEQGTRLDPERRID